MSKRRWERMLAGRMQHTVDACPLEKRREKDHFIVIIFRTQLAQTISLLLEQHANPNAMGA